MQEGSAPGASNRRGLFSPDHEFFRDTVRRFVAREITPNHAGAFLSRGQGRESGAPDARALVCFMALILYRVMRMRLNANKREESPSRLLEQLQRIHQQTVRTADGKALHGLAEMTPAQKSLFTALQMPTPTPAELSQPVLKSALLNPDFL